MIYVSIIQTANDGYLLIADKEDKNVIGWNDLADGLNYYERSYSRHSSMGHEGSMSALINNLFFSPSIVSFDDFNELLQDLFYGSDDVTFVNLHNISGSVYGAKITNHERARELWENGEKPKVA